MNLLDGEQFDIKVEDGVAWDDATSAALSVTEAGGNDNFPTLANFHGSEGLIPASNDLSGANFEAEGSASIPAAVELFD